MSRPWPPLSRVLPEHLPDCLAVSYGPGSGYCDLGCDDYRARVEAYWDGYQDCAIDYIRRTSR